MMIDLMVLFGLACLFSPVWAFWVVTRAKP